MNNFLGQRIFFIQITIIILLFFLPIISVGQSKGYPILAPKERVKPESNLKKKDKVFFPDEYSDLDENTTKEAQLKSKEISDAIEQARQRYFQGMILVQKRDTNRAIRYIEDALSKLNKFSSIPQIENNNDFKELAQQILDDYNKLISTSEQINEDSPAYALNLLINKAIESNELDSVYIKYALEHPLPTTNKVVTKNFSKLAKPPDSIQIPLTDHITVQRSVDFLSRVAKKVFKRWLERSSRWFPMMIKISKEEGLPQEIIYLSMIESALLPNNISSAKAVGLWQFMYATGEMYGLNANGSIFVDERRDPEKSTRAAMRHLRDLYNQFGDWHLAFAAYNCGAGGVSRRIKKAKSDTINFWTIRELLPNETRNYVPQYISAAKIAMDPEAYGFSIDSLNFLPEYEYDTFTLNEPVNLEAIAKAADVLVDDIKELNPELLFNCTPPDMLPYNIKIPKGYNKQFASNFSKLSVEEKAAYLTHKVKSRESLKSIANKYRVKQENLTLVNDIDYGRRGSLKKGQILKIPLSDVSTFDIVDNSSIERNQAQESNINTSAFGKHTISNGETLFSIAQLYGMDVGRLRQINSIKYGDKILIGSQLYIEKNNNDNESVNRIPKNQIANQSVKKETQTIYHKVKKGETLGKIASKYNVTIDDIKQWNKIKKNTVHKNQLIKIVNEETVTIAQNNPPTKIKQNKDELIIHKVKKGENLSSIAANYNVTVDNIKEWNNLRSDIAVKNAKLKIYSGSNNPNITSNSSNSKQDKNEDNFTIHLVQSGETLSSIAKKYKVSEADLKRWNKNEINGDVVYANTKLNIQSNNDDIVSTNKKGAKVKYYKVKPGDTLSEIAKKFGVSTKALRKNNNNVSERNLQAGVRLKIQ